MNTPIYMDAEYESIRTVMQSRGKCAGQLPGKTVRFIPADRADTVLALDERIRKLRKAMPVLIAGTVLLAFLIGTAL